MRGVNTKKLSSNSVVFCLNFALFVHLFISLLLVYFDSYFCDFVGGICVFPILLFISDGGFG